MVVALYFPSATTVVHSFGWIRACTVKSHEFRCSFCHSFRHYFAHCFFNLWVIPLNLQWHHYCRTIFVYKNPFHMFKCSRIWKTYSCFVIWLVVISLSLDIFFLFLSCIHSWSYSVVAHHFEIASWLLVDIAGFGCPGDLLMYLVAGHMSISCIFHSR